MRGWELGGELRGDLESNQVVSVFKSHVNGCSRACMNSSRLAGNM